MKLQAKTTKTVFLYSTMHHSDAFVGEKSAVIEAYNKGKYGVDQVDEMVASYAYAPATRRWPLKLFTWLVDICGANAFVLFKLHHPHAVTSTVGYRRYFLEQLSTQLTDITRFHRRMDSTHWMQKEYGKIAAIHDGIALKLRGQQSVEWQRCKICRTHQPVTMLLECERCRGRVCEADSITTISTVCHACSQRGEKNTQKSEVYEAKTGRCAYCTGIWNKRSKIRCKHCRKFMCASHRNSADPEACKECPPYE